MEYHKRRKPSVGSRTGRWQSWFGISNLVCPHRSLQHLFWFDDISSLWVIDEIFIFYYLAHLQMKPQINKVVEVGWAFDVSRRPSFSSKGLGVLFPPPAGQSSLPLISTVNSLPSIVSRIWLLSTLLLLLSSSSPTSWSSSGSSFLIVPSSVAFLRLPLPYFDPFFWFISLRYTSFYGQTSISRTKQITPFRLICWREKRWRTVQLSELSSTLCLSFSLSLLFYLFSLQ